MGKLQSAGLFLLCLREWCHFHQRFDPFPGDLCLMNSIEQLRCTGGFHRQLGKAGKKCRKGCHIKGFPAVPQYISASKIQDKQYPCHGNDTVYRRQCAAPDICLHCSFFIGRKFFFISCFPLLFTSINPVGNRIGSPVQRCCT